MENAIKTILNYDADNASQEDRKHLIDVIINLSLMILSKDKRYNSLEKIDYILTDEINGGRYGKNGLRLYSNIFCDSDAYLNDLSILSHELCHYAQDNLVDQTKLAKSNNRLICSSQHYNLLLYFIMQNEYPTALQLAEIFGFGMAVNSNEGLRKIKSYLHCCYELQSFEIDANNFSIEFLNFFINEAKKLPLTLKEKSKLLEYNKSIKNVIKSFYDYIDGLRSLRQNANNQQIIQKSVRSVINNIFESFPEFFKTIKFEPESDLDTMATLLELCLEVEYNDEIAHKFFKQLIMMDSNENRDEKLLNLGVFTKIKFSQDEEVLFKKFIESTDIIGSSIDYETLMKEKERVLEERLQMNVTSTAKQKE